MSDRNLSRYAQSLREHATDASALLKALGHPARLLICCQLQNGELSVGEIETVLGIRQPRLSRELAKLRKAKLVKTRRQSKMIFYSLADDRARRVIEGVERALNLGDKSEGSAARVTTGLGVLARLQDEDARS